MESLDSIKPVNKGQSACIIPSISFSRPVARRRTSIGTKTRETRETDKPVVLVRFLFFADKKVLIPLTSSLYVPGKIKDTENVIVDIGTGYFVEKVRSLVPPHLHDYSLEQERGN